MTISERYFKTLNQIHDFAQEIGRNSDEISLIAVSKGRSIEEIMELYNAGCRDFGESRVQEALEKIEKTPPDIRWHLIGSLQTKKVPKIIGKFHLIHSVDSFELAKKISECGERASCETRILLQVNVSEEASKHGMSPEQSLKEYLAIDLLPNIVMEGLMTMAPKSDNKKIIQSCFSGLRQLRDLLGLTHLSMGMSQDLHEAIAEGATLVRVGTSLFSS